MKASAVLGVSLGVLVFASAFAHAFLGWPELGAALARSNVDVDAARALRIGWYFGSAAMLAFGLVLATSGIALLRGRSPSLAPAWIVAAAYFLFGLGAFVLAARSAHFVAFMVIGALAGLFAATASRAHS